MTASKIFRPSVSRLYRIGTVVFLAASLILGGSIAALALTKTTIVVTISGHEISTDTTITVVKTSADESSIAGTISTASAEATVTEQVSSDGPTVDDYAAGIVTLHNTYTKAQPLAAGTRLKSSLNNLIYRTNKSVDIPVNGTVEVSVTADDKGATGNVEPGRFVIVALWPGLQDKIYGESTSTFTGGTRQSGTLTQAAIDDASKNLLDKLTSDAVKKLPAAPAGMTYIGDPVVTASGTSTPTKAGTEISSYSLLGTVTIAVLSVSKEAVNAIVMHDLANKVTSGEELVSDSIKQTIRITNISPTNGTATLAIMTTATVRPTTSNSAFTASRFTGKSQADVLSLLRGTPGVSDAAVSISPFWSSKTSASASRITITVKHAQ